MCQGMCFFFPSKKNGKTTQGKTLLEMGKNLNSRVFEKLLEDAWWKFPKRIQTCKLLSSTVSIFVSQENRHVFLRPDVFEGLSLSKEWRLQYTWYSIKNIPLESKPMTRIYNTCWQTMNVHIPDVLASTISCAALHLQSASILLWAASLLNSKSNMKQKYLVLIWSKFCKDLT